MQPRQLLEGPREQAERVLVAQVGLDRERQSHQIGQTADVTRLRARRIEPGALQRHILVGVGERRAQPLELQLRQPLARHRLLLGVQEGALATPRTETDFR